MTRRKSLPPTLADQLDTDADQVPDGCDLCQGSDDALDANAISIPDGCEPCTALDFDGVDDYVVVAAHDDLVFTSITAEAWVKLPATASSGAAIMSKEFSANESTRRSLRARPLPAYGRRHRPDAD